MLYKEFLDLYPGCKYQAILQVYNDNYYSMSEEIKNKIVFFFDHEFFPMFFNRELNLPKESFAMIHNSFFLSQIPKLYVKFLQLDRVFKENIDLNSRDETINTNSLIGYGVDSDVSKNTIKSRTEDNLKIIYDLEQGIMEIRDYIASDFRKYFRGIYGIQEV